MRWLLAALAIYAGAMIAVVSTAPRLARAETTVLASYYGFESGSRTANGERFDPNGFTAAHRTLPFNTRLRVSFRGRSVVVRVNDRGPFVRGRGLDLSLGAAKAIGLVSAGIGSVTVERLN